MRVFLIASSQFLPSYREFLGERSMAWRQDKRAPSGQQLIEFAGRVCYMSFGARQSSKSNSQYVRHLIGQGHESVLEHSSYSILADDISRGLSHQLVRHRAGFSYSQLSQQYYDESDTSYVTPLPLKIPAKVKKTLTAAMQSSKDAYRLLVRELSSSSCFVDLNKKERLRAIRSAARSVLPNATVTTLVMTGNARAWRHVLKLRGSIRGDIEMREFCVRVLRLLQPVAPDLFRDFKIRKDTLGTFVSWKEEHT